MTAATAGWALLAAPPLLPLFMTALNLLTWQRGRPGARFDGRVSVLIPARDEQASIVACVRAAAASRHPVHEILVYDDQSTDATPQLLEQLRAEVPALRVLRGGPLPPGWIGKPHACHQLAQAATGALLVFVDADTRLEPEGVERLVSLLAGAQLVTVAPRQVMGSFAERLLLPLLALTYTSWFPLRLVAASRDPRLVAANGQVLALRRADYLALGGFAAVAREIVDDVALCRHAKRQGARVVFADGARVARCRMYRSAGALWAGFSKNLYEGIGAAPAALALVVLLHALCFLVPYGALALSGAALRPALWGVGANVLLRALLALRFGHPLEGLLLHPLGILGLLAIAVNSYRWDRRGALRWSGRVYPARRLRRAT